MGLSHFLGRLVEAHGKVGQVDEGLEKVNEALAFVDQSKERWYEAELYRLKGEPTLQFQAADRSSKVNDEAEACFQIALNIPHHQQGNSFELRAAISLARLW